jgi:hypothetical protein
MKHLPTFEQFINELHTSFVSGTRGTTVSSLERRKYELKKDVKNAQIGGYENVVLPKGTIISSLPGGVFANHEELKDKYCKGYNSQKWDSKYGVMIVSNPETLKSIESDSKIIE